MKLVLSLYLMIFSTLLNAQQIQRSTISIIGGSFQSTELFLHSSFGQSTMSGTMSSDSIVLRQGFEQPLIIGCMDSNACNYNEFATIDNGNCHYPSSSTNNVSSCDSFEWNGEVYTEGGSYTFNTTNSFGCDSTATLHLTLNTSSSSFSDLTICDDSYTWINNVTYTETGDYTYISTNSTGCPDTNILSLTINESTISNDTIVVCDDYEWNGEIYTETGDYTIELINSNNCFDIANLNLTIYTLEVIQIEGSSTGFIETSNNTYSIENSADGSVYHWSLSNPLGTIYFANEDSSEISITWGSQDEYVTLCVYEEDQYGCFGEEMCMEVNLQTPASIDENASIPVNIFPNPFTNETTISFSNPTNEEVNIQLLDSKGKVVKDYNDITSENFILKKDNLSNGLYFINLEFNNYIHRSTIIIQ